MSVLQTDPIPAHLDALDAWLAERGFDGAARAAVTTLLAAGPAPAPMSWEEFKRACLEQYSPQLRAKATRHAIEHAFRELDALNVRAVQDLDVRLIARIVSTRDPDLSPRTVQGLLRQVSAIASHAVAFGGLSVNPFKARPIRTWVRAGQLRDPGHITKAEMRRIFEVLDADVREKKGRSEWCSRRLRCFVKLIGFSGLRKNEALHLHVSDIDLAGGVINLVSRASYRLKADSAAKPVPIVRPLADELRDWLSHREAPPFSVRHASPYVFPCVRTPTPWVFGSQGTRPLCRFQEVARRAGVKGATLQKLRRSVATHLEAAGVGPAMIARILRHSPQVDAQFYRKFDIENVQAAMANFTY